MKKNVRRLMAGIMVLAMIAAIKPTIAFAAEKIRGSYFVDADNDGVCDNYAQGNESNFVDENGDGVCDNQAFGNRGSGHNRSKGQAVNFTDTNGDGICDNRTSGNGRKFCGGRNR